MNKIIKLGEDNQERLFLKSSSFNINNNTLIEVNPTNILPEKQMAILIARHKGRYYLVGLFLRPNYKLLDFPCGSGYGAEILKEFNIYYEGRDNDKYTIEYANRVYGDKKTKFIVDDLCGANLPCNNYDVIACIEGLEHIEEKYQKYIIDYFYSALKSNGILIISTPESQSIYSGPNPNNPYHKWELSRKDFLIMLKKIFFKVEIITTRDILHTGDIQYLMFGICKK